VGFYLNPLNLSNSTNVRSKEIMDENLKLKLPAQLKKATTFHKVTYWMIYAMSVC
jgi:hypothetical protein